MAQAEINGLFSVAAACLTEFAQLPQARRLSATGLSLRRCPDATLGAAGFAAGGPLINIQRRTNDMLRRLLISILLTTSISASADEVEDQINLGLESYKNKEYKAAVDDLNYAVAQIQEKMNLKNATLLPEPLDGWTATAVENNSAGMAMMVGGTQMSRSYQHDSESLEISITAGSPMVAGVLMMINNPMLLSSSPDMKPYRYKRIKGMQQVSGNRVETTLALAGQIMVQVTATNLADPAVIERYLDAMDFDQIQSALLQ
jgi:hypothetical protein